MDSPYAYGIKYFESGISVQYPKKLINGGKMKIVNQKVWFFNVFVLIVKFETFSKLL